MPARLGRQWRAVNICHLKRAAADLKHAGHRITESLYTPSGKSVAVIGAGPAGVAAAHDLSMLGHDVTIFEREQEPGGMLRYGSRSSACRATF